MAKIVKENEVGIAKVGSVNASPNEMDLQEIAESTVANSRKKIEKITTGEVKMRKKTVSNKVKSSVFADDLANVGDYLLNSILIPTIQDTIVNLVRSGVETLIYGTDSKSTRSRSRNGYTSYSNVYSSNQNSQRTVYKMNRDALRDVDDVIVGTRDEAEGIIDTLIDLTREYGCASLADLKDLIGVSSNYNDYKWGWKDKLARESGIRKCREGWLIQLPPLEKLD